MLISLSSSSGGDISLSADGDIATGNLNSFSFSRNFLSSSSLSSSGGDINLSAGGEIRGEGNEGNAQVWTFSASEEGRRAGAGGTVILEANAISGLEVITLSSAGQSADVQIRGSGDSLEISNLSLITSAQVEIPDPNAPDNDEPVDFGGGLVFIPDPDDTITLDTGNFGQAGETTISSTGNLIFNDVVIQSDANGDTDAGGVTLFSPGEIQLNRSRIDSNANSSGDAGNIQITADAGITIQGLIVDEDGAERPSGIFASTNNAGQGGSIRLTTPQLTLADTAAIEATTSTSARGGNLTFEAPTALTIDNEGQISASTRGGGRGGDLVISTPESVTIRGNGALVVETAGSGQQGNVTITTPTLTIQDNIQISANATETATVPEPTSLSNDTTDPGGNFTVNASQINLSGSSRLLAETQGSAPAGTLTLRPYNNDANLTIHFQDEAQISASTSGSSSGGDLIVNAPESVRIQGEGQLNEEGQLIVESRGDNSGRAGNLEVTAPLVVLDNGIELTAESESGDGGGNVNFFVSDALVLRRGSFINAEATNASEGNGGNINI